MNDPFADPEIRRRFNEQFAQLENLAMHRERRAMANQITLMEAGLPLNAIVLELAPTVVRLYIRALASSRAFHCDVLDRSVLANEPVSTVVTLMRCHLFERCEVGIRIHEMTASYPCAHDLIDPTDDPDE